MKIRLQDQKIKGLKPHATKRIELLDAIVPGLMLRLTTGGVKSFYIRYRLANKGGPSKTGKLRRGKPDRMYLGTYPAMTLVEAREQARLALEQVDLGIDPRPERVEAVREEFANTLASVAKRFVEMECKGLASQKRIEQALAKHVLPTLGHRPIRELGRGAIHALLDKIVENTGAGAAAGVQKHLHRLFKYAVNRELMESNPAHDLDRKDLKQNGEAGRALDDAELRAIWQAAGELKYPMGPWIRLLMLTGQRRNEWAEAKRSEIDVEGRCLEIPHTRYKTGRAMIVPLVEEAWEIFDDLPIWNEGDFLFSTTGGRKAINSAGAAKKKIDALAPTERPWRLHDLRVTCKTRMATLGVKPEHSEAVLGHTKKGMDAVYNKAQYEVEKRQALAIYADHLLDIVG